MDNTTSDELLRNEHVLDQKVFRSRIGIAFLHEKEKENMRAASEHGSAPGSGLSNKRKKTKKAGLGLR